MGRNNERVEIAVDVRVETERAFGVTEDDGKTIVWLPKSQVERDQDAGTITLPEWLAIDRGLV